MSIFNNNVGSPLYRTAILGGVFPASGSGGTVNYDWSVGMSGSTVTRNTSGSFTVTLSTPNYVISGSVSAQLQLADDTANDADCYSLNLTNVYLKDSGSFQVNVLSGSNKVRHDAANGKVHFQVFVTDVAGQKNTP